LSRESSSVRSDSATPPTKIRKLDENTVRQIAAGEVVERPASVVKELVENSLDARSREIRVSIEGGGCELIEVADDGWGIPQEEFPMAFERHATSKLTDASQLFTVTTLGFRGEALASIAAVSKVKLTSRASSSAEAYEVEAEAGQISPPRRAARAIGTTVEVRDLFFNTPARRKFLKSAASEMLRITDLVERLYLANPSVTFLLFSGGKEVARYPAASSLREAAGNVFGVEFIERSFEFSGTGGPGIWVEGLSSHPSLTRGTSSRMAFAVNGRVIFSRSLTDALRSAYMNVIPRGRYPVALAHLKVESGYVDVNVHPTKREVRFQWEDELRDSLRSLVRSHLETAERPSPASRPVPSMTSTPILPSASTQGTFRTFEQEFLAKSAAGGLRPPEEKLRGFRVPVEGHGPSHPPITILGQIADLYIVGELATEAGPGTDGGAPIAGRAAPGTMILIDAHAASERVIYEKLRGNAPTSHQDLLSPVEVDLTPRQVEVWKACKEDVERMGFVVEPFGGRTFRIHAVPSFLWHRVEPERLKSVLDELAEGNSADVKESIHGRVAKTVACHMAIRGGDALTVGEMRRLLEELYSTRENFTCPHGRPIMVTLSREELDRWFHRPSSKNLKG
jgi:DNA mismatch repair protein MutL